MCKNKDIWASLPVGATQEQDETRAAFFDALYSMNVNDKVEKRDNLTYLSWAPAWAEFKKAYPSASYRILSNPDTNLPYFVDPEIGIMVFTEVTANGQTYSMWLPVMDSRNRAMKLTPYTYQVWDKASQKYLSKTVEAATMFDINKTIMRCLVKNLAIFGLGLYIYAGEDLPEAEDTTAEEKPVRKERKTKTTVPADNSRFSGIMQAVNSANSMTELLDLYNQHRNEVEGNPAIKALFTNRKNQLQ